MQSINQPFIVLTETKFNTCNAPTQTVKTARDTVWSSLCTDLNGTLNSATRVNDDFVCCPLHEPSCTLDILSALQYSSTSHARRCVRSRNQTFTVAPSTGYTLPCVIEEAYRAIDGRECVGGQASLSPATPTTCPGLCYAPAGYQVAVSGTNLEPCPANHYNNGSAKACTPCPAGTLTNEPGLTHVASCECLPGYHLLPGVCTACELGTYKAEPEDRFNSLPCTQCPQLETTLQTARANASDCVCCPASLRTPRSLGRTSRFVTAVLSGEFQPAVDAERRSHRVPPPSCLSLSLMIILLLFLQKQSLANSLHRGSSSWRLRRGVGTSGRPRPRPSQTCSFQPCSGRGSCQMK